MAAWICLHIKNERLLTVEDDMYINVLQLSWPIADSRSTVMFNTDALESSSQIELTAGLFTWFCDMNEVVHTWPDDGVDDVDLRIAVIYYQLQPTCLMCIISSRHYPSFYALPS